MCFSINEIILKEKETEQTEFIFSIMLSADDRSDNSKFKWDGPSEICGFQPGS